MDRVNLSHTARERESGATTTQDLGSYKKRSTDLTRFPANGGFYIQAFNEIGPLLDMTAAVAGPFCWRDSHPLERQLDSLHHRFRT